MACPTLRNTQVTDREAEALHVFTSLQYYCFPYCFCLSSVGVKQPASTFLSVIQSLLGGLQATILPFVEGYQRFHLEPITLQLIKKPGFPGLIPIQNQTRLILARISVEGHLQGCASLKEVTYVG